MEYKDFIPKILWKRFMCYNCYPIFPENSDDVLKKANEWVKNNNIKVLNVETWDYEVEQTIFIIPKAHLRIWYNK